MTWITSWNSNHDMNCPICDKELSPTRDDDSYNDFYYCSDIKPFYHVFKYDGLEIVYLCNDGKIIHDFGNPFEDQHIFTITYKDQSVILNKAPEFNPKELPSFIKTAVRNIAFL